MADWRTRAGTVFVCEKRAAIDVVAQGAGMDPEEAYMLLSIVGELRIGTSPRPVMAARLIVPRDTLAAAGWSPSW